MNNQTVKMILLDEKQADTIFLSCWRRILSYFIADRTNFKAAIALTNHNHVSLRIKSLESSGELTVRLYAAHLLSHIIAHVSALLFRQF